MLQKISRAQRELVSLDFDTDPERWSENVALALRDILGTENIYLIEPEDVLPDNSEASDRLRVYSPLSGTDLAGGIAGHFSTYDDAGFSVFKEDYSTFLHRIVRCAGARAIHDAPLYSREHQESSLLHQEILGPAGIHRQMALSTPLIRGEAMLIAGFAHEAFPEHDGEQHQAFSLLLPAFEAAVRFRLKMKNAERNVHETLEKTGESFAIVTRDGALRYCSRTLRRTFAISRDEAALKDAIVNCAMAITALMRPRGTLDELPEFSRAVAVSDMRLHLHAHPVRSVSGAPEVLVLVRSRSVASRVKVLGPEFNLTDREIQVAGLLASGYRDKEIARQLSISPNTARRHCEAILRKLGLSSRAEILPFLFDASGV